MENTTAQLIMVMGLPGSGKTYFAAALAKYLRVAHFNSDRIRKEASEAPAYSTKDRSDIYKRMYARVTETLNLGKTAIVDATFSKALYRKPYIMWAHDHGHPLHLIYLEANEELIAERVGKKRPDSDADFAVYQKIRSEYEPIADAHLTLRTDEGSTDERIAAAVAYINRARQ